MFNYKNCIVVDKWFYYYIINFIVYIIYNICVKEGEKVRKILLNKIINNK